MMLKKRGGQQSFLFHSLCFLACANALPCRAKNRLPSLIKSVRSNWMKLERLVWGKARYTAAQARKSSRVALPRSGSWWSQQSQCEGGRWFSSIHWLIFPSFTILRHKRYSAQVSRLQFFPHAVAFRSPGKLSSLPIVYLVTFTQFFAFPVKHH